MYFIPLPHGHGSFRPGFLNFAGGGGLFGRCVDSPRGLRHSRGVFENVGVFFRACRRYADCEGLRSVVSSVGTDLCHDADNFRSFDGQRSCAGLVIHLGPINLMVVLLKPNEERLAVPGQNKVAGGMFAKGLAQVRQHLGQIIPAVLSQVTDMPLR